MAAGQDVAAGSDLPVNLVLTDTAGNASAAYTTAIAQSQDGIDATPPSHVSAAVTGASLVLTYAEALDGTNIPAVNAFTVTVGGSAVSVTNVAVDGPGKTVTLTLAQAVQHGQAVTVAYADPTSGDDVSALQDVSGNDAASLPATAVTNLTVQAAPQRFVFGADDGTMGYELWVTDGTEAGTTRVKDINPGTNGSSPSDLTALGTGKAVFSANDGTAGNELWVTDGTAAGTTRVKDINAGAGNSAPYGFRALGNGKAVFIADDGTAGNEVWVTDGTETGTTRVKDIVAGADSSSPSNLTALGNGKAVFSASDGTAGSELWVTDGSEAGTSRVKDIRAGVGGSAPANFMALGNGKAVFIADDGTTGYEIWVTDGSEAGTSRVKDIRSGPGGSSPANFMALGNGTALFRASDGPTDSELWVTDGTEGGTTRVKDIRAGTIGSTPSSFTALGNGKVLFRANDGTTGIELWVTDGTATGTSRVKDINPGATGSAPDNFTVLGNGKAVFSASDGTAGNEVWVTDGTEAGTTRLKDIYAGGGGSAPYGFTALGNGRAMFTADDGTAGPELWVTDGTEAGTTRLKDINPGGNGSFPSSAVAVTAPADTTPPAITAVSIPDQPMKAGDTVTATITVASDSDTYTLGAGSTVAGFALGNLTRVNATTYTASFTVAAGQDVAVGADLPVNLVLTDTAGNASAAYTTAIVQGQDGIDATAPAFVGAAVTGASLVLTYAEALDAAHAPAANAFTVMVGGSALSVTNVAVDGLAKTVTLTLAQAVQHGQAVTVAYADPSGGDDASALQDVLGNDAASLPGTGVTNLTPAADTTPPTISAVSIPDQPAKVGDTVTATITVAADSDTYTLGAGSTVDGFALGNLTKVNATTYTATFAVTADGRRTGDRAANQDVPVDIVLVDGAGNATTPYVTAISQTNDRIDANAAPSLPVPATPPTLVDTAAADAFPMVTGQLAATDLEGDTLTYSVAGSQNSPVQHGRATLSNGITYDTWSTGAGGTSYVNSQTGAYAFVFDAALLNGRPAGSLQSTSTFSVSDGNRSVSQAITLSFTGANDSPILSGNIRRLARIDQGIADASNAGTTVTAMLASAGTATDAESDVPLGVAITGVTNTHGVWQSRIGSGSWADIPAGSSDGAALLLAGSDRIRFVPSGSGFTNTETGGITFKAWDRTSGTAGSTVDAAGDSAFSTASATATITADAVPTLTATGGRAVFGIGASSPTRLFGGVAASTVEAGQSFRGAVFTVSGVVDATEVLRIGGTDIALVGGTNGTLTGLGAAGGDAGVTVSVMGGVATVTVDGLERDDAQMSALLGGLAYRNSSFAATPGNRVIAIAGLTDSGGATGTASITGVSTVVAVADVTPPTGPAITSAALSNSAAPILSGTAEAGSRVGVTVGGATYAVTAVGGTWSLDLATAAPVSGVLNLHRNGANAVSVTATDAAGNVSAAGTQTLVIDTTRPNAPVVTTTLSNSAAPILAGTAEAGSRVGVAVGGATYAVTAAGGTWSLDLATTVPVSGALTLDRNGANAVSVTATDAAGNVSAADTQTLVVDTTRPDAPAVTSAALSNSAAPILAGTAEAGSRVGITVGGASYAVTAAGGAWSLDLATAAPVSGVLTLDRNGANAVSVTATDAAGNVSAAGTQTLIIDTTGPSAPAVPTPPSNGPTPPIAGTVDGATVDTAVTTGSDGSPIVTVTIAATDASRVEDRTTANADFADVPVVRETILDPLTGQATSVAILTVSVPTGVGVVATGSAGRQTAEQAQTGLTGLIAAIQARTDQGTAARTDLTGGGSGFLAELPAQAQLLVRTIAVSAPGVAPGQPVQLRVSGNTLGGTGSTMPTAIVFDTTAVSGPVTIRLDNVDFAAVVGNATLVGGDGRQVVYGDGNQQYLYLGADDDILHGGGGNDTVASAGGNDTLFGDQGDDSVLGGDGDDRLFGGTGRDTVFGELGDDVLFGQDDDDFVGAGSGNDFASGGYGNDEVHGEDGDDLLFGDEGRDGVYGEAGNDRVHGGTGGDFLFGGDGNDAVLGEGGDDLVRGDASDDALSGGEGNDLLSGDAGSDLLFGNAGNDELIGGDGRDRFAFGRGDGHDVIRDFVTSGAEADTIAFNGGAFTRFEEVQAAVRQVGDDAVIDYGDGDTVTLRNVQAANLTAANVTFS
ncbi:ELWxxDGT repeat protein [Methylobacterium oryzisoli]|uniref:ELWxxDGT repeat protein n=1 Tax=Methylobacterium oryzisoli TaxID=3385502 RepID=UPI0038929DE3